MDKATATEIMSASVSMDAAITRLDRCISSLPEGEEKDILKKALGDLMGHIFRYFVYEVETQYPELNPDD